MNKERFFLSSSGDLYRNRATLGAPLREKFAYTFGRINTTNEFKATLRAGAVAWPGGYPMFLITSDGAALHFDCARKELRSILDSIKTRARDGWRVVASEVNWEDSTLYCDHCSKKIESAYGDDDDEEANNGND